MTQQPSPRPRLQPVIRVFVSSTFSDMKQERNALEAEAYPKLEQLCQRHGFQFQAIDLRWGVSTEAGLDHRTMRICFDELRRAQKISPRPNFLILLGNRYGWRPLPEEISVEEFYKLDYAAGQIPDSADKSAVAILREWYREDTNADPPTYLLQSRRQRLGDDQDYTHDVVWTQVQAILWTIINQVMPPEQLQRRFDGSTSDGSPPAIVQFQASATEQEIWHGALRVRDAREHVLAFFREIENLTAFSDPKQIKDFVDVDPSGSVEVALQTEQDRLKAELRQRLDSANVFRNEAPARLVEALDNQGGRTADVTTDHLDQLCADVVSRLSEIIQGQIEEYWRNTAPTSTDRAARELEIEQLEYERFAKERGGEESFVGRQAELQAMLDYVGSNSRWPLVIHGASGCGKTALLARASQEVSKTLKRIERFIGVAPRSSDLRSLLSSLCQELRQRNPHPDPLPAEIKELRDEFSQHLQAATPEQPLILFLDALDQLADADNGRLLNWLPFGSLPAHVKLVVSCLSDRATGDPSGQPYAELKRRQIPAENFINLDVLSEAEARLLLFDRWLPKAGRKVSDDQRARIEQRLASPAFRQPIYLKLLFEEVRLWRSYDKVRSLGGDIPKMLTRFFARLRRRENHGRLLVNRVLGYLSASRHGLAENEILEILFADPEYKKKLRKDNKRNRHELPLNAKRIPIALWSRLRFDLAPYLTERAAPGANVLTFYHRQVAEWVKAHLVDAVPWKPHAQLAAYFAAQPLHPDHDSPGRLGRAVNRRKLDEEAWLVHQAGDYERLRDVLSDIDLVSAFTCEGQIDEVIDYWRLLSDRYSVRDAYRASLESFMSDKSSDPDYAEALNNVARIYRAVGDIDGATDLLSAAQSRLQATGAFMTAGTALTYGNLAVLEAERGNLAGAEKAWASEILILSTIAPATPLLLRARNNLTRHYISTGRFDKAEESSQAFFETLETVKQQSLPSPSPHLPEWDPQYLPLWSAHCNSESAHGWANWSEVLHHRGANQDAVFAQEKAVAFATDSPQCPPEDLAQFLYKLSRRYESVDNTAERYAALIRARSVLAREVTPDYLHQALVTAQLVHTELHRQNIAQAKVFLDEFVQQLSYLRPTPGESITDPVRTLASDLAAHDLHEGAQRILQSCLALLSEHNLARTLDAATVFHELAREHMKKRDYTQALKAEETAFEICSHVRDGLGIVNTARCLADIHFECAQIPAAETALRTGIECAKGVKGAEALTGELWRALGLLQEKQGLWQQVELSCRQAATCFEHDLTHFAEGFARSLAYRGEALDHLGQPEQAEQAYRMAIAAAKAHLGERHRFTLVALGMLMQMQTRQGHQEEATATLAEIASLQSLPDLLAQTVDAVKQHHIKENGNG